MSGCEVLNEDLGSDGDEDEAAEDFGLLAYTRAEPAASAQPGQGSQCRTDAHQLGSYPDLQQRQLEQGHRYTDVHSIYAGCYGQQRQLPGIEQRGLANGLIFL